MNGMAVQPGFHLKHLKYLKRIQAVRNIIQRERNREKVIMIMNEMS